MQNILVKIFIIFFFKSNKQLYITITVVYLSGLCDVFSDILQARTLIV